MKTFNWKFNFEFFGMININSEMSVTVPEKQIKYKPIKVEQQGNVLHLTKIK